MSMREKFSSLSFTDFMRQLSGYDENKIPGATLINKDDFVHQSEIKLDSAEIRSERVAWVASVLYATERELLLLAKRGRLVGEELRSSLHTILKKPPKYNIYVKFEGVIPSFSWGEAMKTISQSALELTRPDTEYVPTKNLQKKIRTRLEEQTFRDLKALFPDISFEELYYERHAVAGRYEGASKFLLYYPHSFKSINRAERKQVYLAELRLAELRRQVYELKEIRSNVMHYAARILKKTRF